MNDYKYIDNLNIELIDGDRGKNYPRNDEMFDKGYCLFLNAKNVTINGLVFDENVFITREKDELLRKGKLIRNDIVLTTRGTIGNVGLYDESVKFDNVRINSGMLIIRNNDSNINTKYLYYQLTSPFIRDQIFRLKTGSAQPQIPITVLKKLKILIPDKNIQDKIVKVMDSIVNKIRLNNQINDNLFNLINLNYNKYLSEVNELENIEEISVKDIFDFESGIEPGSKNYLEKEDKDTIKFYRVGDMDSNCKTFIKKDLANNKIINEDDIVVSFDATIGRIGYGLNGSFSTGMKKINANSKYKNIIDNSIIYAYFNNIDTQHKILENAKGTTILHAGSAINFLNFKYNEKLLIKYNKIISVFFQKMKHIKKENIILSQLRDTLLPKLMNGEIDLENIEI